jgi:hypothetical protein
MSEYLTYEWFNPKTIGELKESLRLLPDNVKIDALELRLLKNLKTNKCTLQHREKEMY